MSLIDVTPDATPKATKLAEGFIAKTNQVFEEQRLAAYSAVEEFWYRNQDENGDPALTGDEPSGLEMLEAMGTKARAFWEAASQRAVMVISIATALGKPEEVDLSKISAPYELTFKSDGSLDTATLR